MFQKIDCKWEEIRVFRPIDLSLYLTADVEKKKILTSAVLRKSFCFSRELNT